MNPTQHIFFLFLSALFSSLSWGQTTGCPDPQATNFVSTQVINDGSCLYPATTILPVQSTTVDAALVETSGLVLFQNQWITHNDGTDRRLFMLDSTFTISQNILLQQASFQDLEEMTTDDQYLYLGNFGNNATGNRQNLSIQRIRLDSLHDSTYVESIYFSYDNQTNFSNTGPNNTNFDCEAFLIIDDSIYLFTKQWVDLKTRVYRLPKVPGTYVAECIDSFFINGLVTGACIDTFGAITLSGYSPTLQPFVFLLNDYHHHAFFSGNKRRINIQLPFHQMESIATSDGLTFWTTNEYFKYSIIEIPQQIHQFDLSIFNPMITSISEVSLEEKKPVALQVYPNPANHILFIQFDNIKIRELIHENWQIYNVDGHLISVNQLNGNYIYINNLIPGTYFLHHPSSQTTLTFIKQ